MATAFAAENLDNESQKVAEEILELPLQMANDVLLNMSSHYFTSGQFEIEVAGFRLMRRDVLSSTIGIPDIDLALGINRERLMPLVRMIYAFGLKITGDKNSFSLQAEFAPAVEVNLQDGTIAFDGVVEPLEYVAGISEITNTRDVYIRPETFARVFNIEITWEDDLYEYLAVTDELLKMWRGRGKAYTGHEAELVSDTLPELFGMALPDNNSLDYMQLRVAADISARENDDVRVTLNTAEDFWGGLLGGRYQLRFQQPSLEWREGNGFESGEQKLSVPRYFNWAKTFDKSEVTIGDSFFAVNELVLPTINFTGARVNGILGSGSNEINELTSFNLEGSFVDTRRYEGEAELGSTVTLFINDTEVATAEVYEEPDSAVGFGRYQFDEVSIPSGNLVSIRIEIVEPDGRRVVRDLSTVKNNKLRPAGRLAYVGGIGTVREDDEWSNHGLIGGARVLYGINSRLTVGATVGHQSNASSQRTSVVNVSNRLRAEESDHYGLEMAFNPFSKMVVSASVGQSEGQNELQADDAYRGKAYTFDADYRPHRRLNLNSQVYRYERGFFNGINEGLEDREGYYINMESYFPHARLSADYGSLNNNIDDELPFTIASDYYGVRLSSSAIIPGSYMYVEFDEIRPDFFDSKSISTFGLRTNFGRLNLDASITDGDLSELEPLVKELFQNISLPNVRITGSPSSSLSLSQVLGNHRLVLEFDGVETDLDQRTKFTHYWDSVRGPGEGFWGGGSLRVVNEFGYNQLTKSETVSNRINLYLDPRRRNRLGMVTTYDGQIGWSWELDFNLTNVFALRKGRVVNVSAASVNPSYGGTSGMVFLDKNANGVRDGGEQGVQGIRVVSTDTPNGATTDRYGEFYLSRRANQSESVVYVDINSVPATMIPVHAKQTALLEKGLTSRAEFALAPMVSLTGVLMSPEHEDKNTQDQTQKGGTIRKPMSGVRIELTDPDGKVIAESITATDGSYFFNAIPGQYELWVDPHTVHPLLTFNEPAFSMQVVGVEEYQELEFEPIYAELLSKQSSIRSTSVPAPSQQFEQSNTQSAAPAVTQPPIDSETLKTQTATPQQMDALEDVPLDLTRPRITVVKPIEDDQLKGIVHEVAGQFMGQGQNSATFSPIAGARLVVTDNSGIKITEAITGADGYYRFQLEAGSYVISIDPASVSLNYIYDEPALTLKIPRKVSSQRITLQAIFANYIELAN